MENNTVFKLIDNSIEKNKKIQTILFTTSKNINLDEYVVYYVNCVQSNRFNSVDQMKKHLNFFVIDEQAITKDLILEAINRCYESVSQYEANILIIKNIDKGSSSSLNALLKFIEDMPSNSFLIMTTSSKMNVLNTILSRSFVIEINNKNTDLVIQSELLKNSEFKDFFAFYTDDLNLISSFYNEKLEQDLKSLTQAFESSKFSNVLKVLVEVFSKENAKIIIVFLISYLCEYLTDSRENLKRMFIVKNTENTDWNTEKLLILLNEQQKIFQKNTINFAIQKANFLLKLSEEYGK